MSSVVGF